MTQLIQVVYISRATFKPAPAEAGIEPTVARILQQSRINNPRLGIGGVLYYGDGCFFQCLEGEAEAVDQLLEKLKLDPRHTDFEVVLQRDIKEREFARWSMKYVQVYEPVRNLIAGWGMKRFDPYQLDKERIVHLLRLFRELRARQTGDDSAQEAAEASGGRGATLTIWLIGAALFAMAVAVVVVGW